MIFILAVRYHVVLVTMLVAKALITLVFVRKKTSKDNFFIIKNSGLGYKPLFLYKQFLTK